ncbi:MAG: hypothetical protein MZV63_30795 [Marinilabiliales bacterium]|nr:hypothetical protein [Marinilabiliales bacterium]
MPHSKPSGSVDRQQEVFTSPTDTDAKTDPLLRSRPGFGPGNGMGRKPFSVFQRIFPTKREALQKYDRLFENNPALMAVSDLSSRIFVEVNSAFLKNRIFKGGSAIGKASADLDLFIDPDHAAGAGRGDADQGFGS